MAKNPRRNGPWDEVQPAGTSGSGGASQAPALLWWQTRRRWLEVAFWPIFASLAWGLDTLIKFQQVQRFGMQPDTFRLVTEQVTSCAAAVLMVPVVLAWLNRFPLRATQPGRVILEQLGGSLVFSIGHFCLLIGMRVLVHASQGGHYEWQGGLWYNLLFEYQKDVGIYALVVLIVSGYGYIQSLRVQLQQDAPGEAQLCVQTGRGESVIKLSEVDYLEAARNYVTVHSRDREYLLRETMANLAEQLQSHGFLRCHRSFLVNLQQVSEIRSKDSSGHEVALLNGRSVPLSRGYKQAFKSALLDGQKPGSE